jgi:glucose/arabinose dehydrogenase
MSRLQKLLMACVLVLNACGGSGSGEAPVVVQPPPVATVPSVTSTAVFTQLPVFSQPVALLQAPGDSNFWYVLEKNGVVRVFANDQAASATSIFLDISAVVDPSGEGGLLGMAFHPNYPLTPEVIVSYTRTGSPLTSYISKFTSTDNGQTLNGGTEEVLFTVLQDQSNHNGGNIAYGPDGNIYVAFGDGGGAGDPNENAQNTSNLKGTIVRITVNAGTGFSIPSDNPFAANAICTQGTGAAACPEIFAWGLRNPWRFSFDSVTGKLWAGDVGQGAFEEIDLIELGNNYGWNDREGAHCFDPMTGCANTFAEPITEYGRTLGGSITGGYVYRGSTLTDLVGWYVFGDFSSGRLFAIREDSSTGTVLDELDQTGLQIVSFGQGNDGELYILNFAGTIHQLIAGS